MKDTIYVAQSPIHGEGVFARSRIQPGSRIGRFQGTPTEIDGTYVLWVLNDDGSHLGIEGTTELRFLNHSEQPNAEFEGDELYATRTIEPHDEITLHYGDAWD